MHDRELPAKGTVEAADVTGVIAPHLGHPRGLQARPGKAHAPRGSARKARPLRSRDLGAIRNRQSRDRTVAITRLSRARCLRADFTHSFTSGL